VVSALTYKRCRWRPPKPSCARNPGWFSRMVVTTPSSGMFQA